MCLGDMCQHALWGWEGPQTSSRVQIGPRFQQKYKSLVWGRSCCRGGLCPLVPPLDTCQLKVCFLPGSRGPGHSIGSQPQSESPPSLWYPWDSGHFPREPQRRPCHGGRWCDLGQVTRLRSPARRRQSSPEALTSGQHRGDPARPRPRNQLGRCLCSPCPHQHL